MSGTLRARSYAACLGSLGTGVAFFLLGIFKVPVPLYFPLSRRFGMAPVRDELSMDYYGRSLYAVALGALLAGVGYVILASRSSRSTQRSADADRRLWMLASYALTALLLAAGLYGYQLGNREPQPEPLPDWYRPT